MSFWLEAAADQPERAAVLRNAGAGRVHNGEYFPGRVMNTTNRYQLDLMYRGRDITIVTAPNHGGWSWAAVIDNGRTVGGREGAQPSPEMSLDAGRAWVEALVDSEDEGSSTTWLGIGTRNVPRPQAHFPRALVGPIEQIGAAPCTRMDRNSAK